jgi:hypothetical protein
MPVFSYDMFRAILPSSDRTTYNLFIADTELLLLKQI